MGGSDFVEMVLGIGILGGFYLLIFTLSMLSPFLGVLKMKRFPPSYNQTGPQEYTVYLYATGRMRFRSEFAFDMIYPGQFKAKLGKRMTLLAIQLGVTYFVLLLVGCVALLTGTDMDEALIPATILFYLGILILPICQTGLREYLSWKKAKEFLEEQFYRTYQ